MNASKARKDLLHNFIVNVGDGSFFGFALGFTSFGTILPLFISNLTESAILIGLVPAIHNVGWQLPQLFTARWIASLRRLKGRMLFLTTQERIPFLFLALVAWFLFPNHKNLTLIVTFILLVWQGLGGGFTANIWQILMSRVIPGKYRGRFFGVQSSAANLLSSVGAAAAGVILERFDSPLDFTILFSITTFLMVISWIFLSLTKEPAEGDESGLATPPPFMEMIRISLHKEPSFAWFLFYRMLYQFGTMSSAFYMVYAVRNLGFGEAAAGILTSVLLITAVIANPLLGWLADRWKRNGILVMGAVAAGLGSMLAWQAPSGSWFFPVVVLQGIANVSYWTIGMAMTLDYGEEEDRPAYVGLSNTMIAPATILAPIVGGWLADFGGYQLTFLVSAILSLATAGIILAFVRDPHARVRGLA
ncbi:MAG TPA: MFS transporter [Anaerolineaceae bacterium]|nr:MFS transporter [Longilinea sp.]NMD30581.1 MFS transporter [Chloroflexota bacterium]HNY99949.1 MFS transporter [Anaerolineaceae bacterium]HPA32504.1 MFS transporter [Anaerolineaceae bacterium]HQO96328.1 MFS transporter [Anaerolineaceae bacterium]